VELQSTSLWVQTGKTYITATGGVGSLLLFLLDPSLPVWGGLSPRVRASPPAFFAKAAVTLGGTSSWQQNNTGQMLVSDTTGTYEAYPSLPPPLRPMTDAH